MDVQVYNPELRPRQRRPVEHRLHLPRGRQPASQKPRAPRTTDYAAMSYTHLHGTLPCRRIFSDTPISQSVFYPSQRHLHLRQRAQVPCAATPADATPGSQLPPTGTHPTTVNGPCRTVLYHAWTSVLDHAGWQRCKPRRYDDALQQRVRRQRAEQHWDDHPLLPTRGGHPAVGSAPKPAAAPPARNRTPEPPPTNQTTSQSTAHKGYAVRLVAPGTSLICSQDNPPATSPPAACQTTTTMSAMGDMTVYTPIETQGSPAPPSRSPSSSSTPPMPTRPSTSTSSTSVTSTSPQLRPCRRCLRLGTAGSRVNHLRIRHHDRALGNSLGADGSGTSPQPGVGQRRLRRGGVGLFPDLRRPTGTALYNGQWVQLQITVPRHGDRLERLLEPGVLRLPLYAGGRGHLLGAGRVQRIAGPAPAMKA